MHFRRRIVDRQVFRQRRQGRAGPCRCFLRIDLGRREPRWWRRLWWRGRIEGRHRRERRFGLLRDDGAGRGRLRGLLPLAARQVERVEAGVAGAEAVGAAIDRRRADARRRGEFVGRRRLVFGRRHLARLAEARRRCRIALQRRLQQVARGICGDRGRRRRLRRGRRRSLCGCRQRPRAQHRRNGDTRDDRRAAAAMPAGRRPRTQGTHQRYRPRHLASCQSRPPSGAATRRAVFSRAATARYRHGPPSWPRWLTELERIWLTRG